jgi:hypothetical protein
MKRGESYRLMATHIQRELALELFAPHAIARAIHEAASLGYRSYRVVQQHPIDLSDTEHAKMLERWLVSEEFQYAWRQAYAEPDPLRPSYLAGYPELEIMW